MLNRLKERGINGWLVGWWEEVGLPGGRGRGGGRWRERHLP